MAKAKITLRLPYPPTINHYYGRGKRGHVYIKKAGKEYRLLVISRIIYLGIWRRSTTAPLSMSLLVYPPDRRKRDLDNILKALKDAMQHAGVYKDDNQIREYREPFKFMEPIKGGKVVVALEEI